MTLKPGRTLAHYRLVEKIGQGGMGVVWSAEDTKLGRQVAVKILPEEFARDAQRLARFEREAKILAALNHPNVASIHGIEEAEGLRFLVLELVPGQSLAEKLKRGPLPMEEALEICRQVAEGLEAAHEAGVIHRDLKPGNVRVTPDGKAKVLDFGLAKGLDGGASTGEAGDAADLSQSSTIGSSGTGAGVILGTAPYMSPEQSRGKSSDRRTDIWSFGCLLYECLTGRMAFPGETVPDILSSILQSEPDWRALPERTPPRVRDLLVGCLEKSPRNRLHDAADARIVLERAVSEREWTTSGIRAADLSTAPRRGGRSRIAWSLAAIFAAASIALAVTYYGALDADRRVIRAFIHPPEGATFKSSGYDAGPAEISPDGRQIVFTAMKDGESLLWIRPLDSLTATPLAGTEKARRPFWSPDGRFVGFFAGGRLQKIPASGGPPVPLCAAPNGRGGTWNREDLIVFAPNQTGPLFKVSAAGGEATPVTEMDADADEASHRYPHFLPDGRHFLFMIRGSGSTAEGRKASLHVGSVESGRESRLFESSSNTSYASGHLLFVHERTLMAQPFDPEGLTLLGQPFPIAEEIRTDPLFSQAAFSASQNGILAYQSGPVLPGRPLVWYDRSGAVLGTVGEPTLLNDVSLSPDGSQAGLTIVDPDSGQFDLWAMDAMRGVRTRLTSDGSSEWALVWHPSTARIYFSSDKDGPFQVYRRSIAGSGEDELVWGLAGSDVAALDIHPDGEQILVGRSDFPEGRSDWDLWVLSLSGSREARPFLQSRFEEDAAQFSPDGRWVAYDSDEAGRAEVYVTPYPGPGRKQRVSEDGGEWPRWSRDGAELFYLAPDGSLMAARVQPRDDVLGINRVEALFQARAGATMGFPYDVSADGKRFLFAVEPEQEEDLLLTLVVNWTAGLGD